MYRTGICVDDVIVVLCERSTGSNGMACTQLPWGARRLISKKNKSHANVQGCQG